VSPAGRWLDVEFFPLRLGEPGQGALVIGRARPAAEDSPEPVTLLALPERLVALRARWADRHGLGLLSSDLPAMRRLGEQVRLAAQVSAPVTLVGEPGVGKLTTARIIHYHSARREQPLAALDCARLPAPVLARVLEGAREGGPGPGLGAVYLRQPGALPRELQLQLCAWMEAPGPCPRILAGVARSLTDEVRAGRLVEELAWRLGALVLEVPPLRQRRADLPRLAAWLLERGGPGAPAVKGLTTAAREVLDAHSWPGNLRELAAALAAGRASAPAGGLIDAGDLPATVRSLAQGAAPELRPSLTLDGLLEQVERRLILLALGRARGNQSRAAELLGVHRPRLLRRLKVLGILDEESVADKESGIRSQESGEEKRGTGSGAGAGTGTGTGSEPAPDP
jgi:DNA-binding NtrC family response regulator